jgi:hypothetical protein
MLEAVVLLSADLTYPEDHSSMDQTSDWRHFRFASGHRCFQAGAIADIASVYSDLHAHCSQFLDAFFGGVAICSAPGKEHKIFCTLRRHPQT